MDDSRHADAPDRRRQARTLTVAFVVSLALLLPAVAVASSHTEDLTQYTEVDPDPEDKISVSQDSFTVQLDGSLEDHHLYNESGPGTISTNLKFNMSLSTADENHWSNGFVGFYNETESHGAFVGMRFHYDSDTAPNNCWLLRAHAKGGSTGGTNIATQVNCDESENPTNPFWVVISTNSSSSMVNLTVYQTPAEETSVGSAEVEYDSSVDYDVTGLFNATHGVSNTGSNRFVTIGDVEIDEDPSSADVSSISIGISDRFHRNESGPYNVTATLDDGSTSDVTGDATEQSNRTSVLTVDDDGTAQAQDAAGWVRVNASYSGETANATTVVYNQSLEDYRFVTDGVKGAVIFLDWGWVALLVSMLVSSAICRAVDEEIAMMTFPLLVSLGWLLGFLPIWTAVAAVVIAGVVVFRD